MATASTTGDDGPDLDSILTVLSDRRRRRELDHCCGRERIRIGKLAALIAARRPATDDGPADERPAPDVAAVEARVRQHGTASRTANRTVGWAATSRV